MTAWHIRGEQYDDQPEVTKESFRTAQRRYYRKNRDKLVLRRHNITVDRYWHLWDKQDGLCAICDGPPSDNGNRQRKKSNLAARLVIDHDHTNGRTRGLLCGKCNLGLSAFLDDPTFLRKAANYLE